MLSNMSGVWNGVCYVKLVKLDFTISEQLPRFFGEHGVCYISAYLDRAR